MNNPDKIYPVGSVCIIVDAHPSYSDLIGRECTILLNSGCDDMLYKLDIRVEDDPETVLWCGHRHVKLKKFPPETDAWCREKMKWLLKDCPASGASDRLEETERKAYEAKCDS